MRMLRVFFCVFGECQAPPIGFKYELQRIWAFSVDPCGCKYSWNNAEEDGGKEKKRKDCFRLSGRPLSMVLGWVSGAFFVNSKGLFTVFPLEWICSSGGKCLPACKSKAQSAPCQELSMYLSPPEGLFRHKYITVHLCTVMSRGNVCLAYIWGVSSFRKIHFYWIQ